MEVENFCFWRYVELGKKSIEQHKLIGEKCLSLNLDYLLQLENVALIHLSFSSMNKKALFKSE